MKTSRWWLAAGLTAMVACSALRNDNPTRVLVSAAVSLTGVLDQIGAAYHQDTGVYVSFNLAGSDTLATQLIEGAPIDLFLSADGAQMDRVATAGRIVLDTRQNLLANQLVVIVPADRGGTVTEPGDLTSASIRHIALGDPDAVPAGVYARAYLESIGLWETVAGKIVPTRDVRAVLAAVEAGNADTGFVYRTDLFNSKGVRLAFEVPLDEGGEIYYPAAVVTGAPSGAAAARFLEYLRSLAAKTAFEEAGFITMSADS